MSVNAPNIFSHVFLASFGDQITPPAADDTAVLILDPGADWQAAEAASHASEFKAAGIEIGPLYLRVDGLTDGCEIALANLLTAGIQGIVLGGCSGQSHIQHLETCLRVAEAIADRPDGSTPVIVELGGAIEVFLPPRPLASSRLSAVIFNENAARAAIGNLAENEAIKAMHTSAQLIAAQAGVPFFLLGEGSEGDCSLPMVQRLGLNISKTSPASQ